MQDWSESEVPDFYPGCCEHMGSEPPDGRSGFNLDVHQGSKYIKSYASSKIQSFCPYYVSNKGCMIEFNRILNPNINFYLLSYICLILASGIIFHTNAFPMQANNLKNILQI